MGVGETREGRFASVSVAIQVNKSNSPGARAALITRQARADLTSPVWLDKAPRSGHFISMPDVERSPCRAGHIWSPKSIH